jgi:hypothetical protein
MKEVWYRADYDYTPINYGGGTDEFFCIKVEDENDAAQMKAADEEAIKLAKEWAAQGDDYADVGHVDMDLVEVTEVDGNEECFPEIRSVWW